MDKSESITEHNCVSFPRKYQTSSIAPTWDKNFLFGGTRTFYLVGQELFIW